MRKYFFSAGVAFALALGVSLTSAMAEVFPDLEAPQYSVGEVCTEGKLVRVGLEGAVALAVRAPSGLTIAGQSGTVERLDLQAVPWIGVWGERRGASGQFVVSGNVPGWCLRTGDGKLVREIAVVPQRSGEALELFRLQADGSYAWSAYRGSLTFTALHNGKIQPINALPLETYLSGVVPREVPARFEVEALRAMACVARTYTLSHLGQHKNQGFDLCDSVHCQVYGGLAGETANVNEVVSYTAGRVLSSCGRPIDATYHAVCGGWGEAPQNVWDGRKAVPYLQARTDIVADKRLAKIAQLSKQDGACFVNKRDNKGQIHQVLSESEKLWRDFIDNPPQSYCERATRFRWQKSYDIEDLRDRLCLSLPVTLGAKPEAIGERLDVRVTKRAPGGRVAELLIATEKGSWRLGGDKIRWLTSAGRIGKDGLQSSFFYVTREGGQIVFHGCGWGHGVGLCQEGAQGRALAGQTHQQILQHYYPGTVLSHI